MATEAVTFSIDTTGSQYQANIKRAGSATLYPVTAPYDTADLVLKAIQANFKLAAFFNIANWDDNNWS